MEHNEFFAIKVEQMLADILLDDSMEWGDYRLDSLYAMTYNYVETHGDRRILLMRVLDRLVPRW
jgi:hypothetical protein